MRCVTITWYNAAGEMGIGGVQDKHKEKGGLRGEIHSCFFLFFFKFIFYFPLFFIFFIIFL